MQTQYCSAQIQSRGLLAEHETNDNDTQVNKGGYWQV